MNTIPDISAEVSDTYTTAIEYQNVSKAYDGKTVVSEVSAKVTAGELITIVGTSGGGKTTLLKMVNSLVKPDSGKVLVNGIDNEDTNIISLRRNIGYAVQGSVLFPHLTVEQNIAYVPNLLNGKDKIKTNKAVQQWMEILELQPELLQRMPAELSGGQAQRVGIARAFAASPDIALMDEPFSAVDGITRKQLQKELKRIHRQTKMTILFVTHDMSEAIHLGDRIMVVAEGKILRYDTAKSLISDPGSEFVASLLDTA